MDAPLKPFPRPSGPSPELQAVSPRNAGLPIRPRRLALGFALLAVLSTAAGFQVARFQSLWAKWRNAAPVQAAPALEPSPSFVSDSVPSAASTELDKISRLAPQEQAERLLDLAIHRHEASLVL